MPLVTLNPTYEEQPVLRREASALASLDGTTIALLSNGKTNVRPFLNRMEEQLRKEHGVTRIVHLRKSNMSAPAPPDVLREATVCDCSHHRDRGLRELLVVQSARRGDSGA